MRGLSASAWNLSVMSTSLAGRSLVPSATDPMRKNLGSSSEKGPRLSSARRSLHACRSALTFRHSSVLRDPT